MKLCCQLKDRGSLNFGSFQTSDFGSSFWTTTVRTCPAERKTSKCRRILFKLDLLVHLGTIKFVIIKIRCNSINIFVVNTMCRLELKYDGIFMTDKVAYVADIFSFGLKKWRCNSEGLLSVTPGVLKSILKVIHTSEVVKCMTINTFQQISKPITIVLLWHKFCFRSLHQHRHTWHRKSPERGKLIN